MIRFLFTLFLLISIQGRSQNHSNLVERTVEVSIEEENSNLAKKALLEKATEKVSEDLIKEIIGEQKFQRNLQAIQKIIKNSIRYVPFSKPGEMQPYEKGFKLSVMMKINQADLQKVLLENGLFYESDMAPILLPVMTIVDKVQSRQWGWWQPTDIKMNDLIRISRVFESQLKSAFLRNNFYLIRPQALHYVEILPQQSGLSGLFSSQVIDFQSWQKIARPWNVQILVQGSIEIQKAQRQNAFLIQYKLSALHMQNGREIAEVIRTYETEAGVQEAVVEKKLREVSDVITTEIAAQVLDAWQKGTIGSNLFRLTINGKVPLKVQESLREYIKNQIREIKEVKERVISSDQLTLEIDSSINPKEISLKKPNLQLVGYSLVLESANENEVTYRLVKEGTK